MDRLQVRAGLRMLAACALLVAVNTAGIVGATAQDEFVTIHFGVGYDDASTSAACELSVPAGAGGIAVLREALAQDCINSYRTLSYPSGSTLVRCVDGVCSNQYLYGHHTVCTEDECRDICTAAAGCVPNLIRTWWRFSANGTLYQFNINEYRAVDGDVVRVGFTGGI